MNYFWNKIKSFVLGLLVISCVMVVSVSSCNTKKAESSNTEQEVKEKAEHPSDHEHPADSVSSEGEEHPSDEDDDPPSN
jgi:hypothetical protein